MLLTAPNGELLGIRAEWSIKSEYLHCQFTTLRVELNDEVGKDISVTDGAADFSGDHFQCNRRYTPRVKAVLSKVLRMDYSAPLSYESADSSNVLITSSANDKDDGSVHTQAPDSIGLIAAHTHTHAHTHCMSNNLQGHHTVGR